MTSRADAEKALLDLIETGIAASAASLAEVSGAKWTTRTLSIVASQNDGVGDFQARLAGDKLDQYGAFMSMPGIQFLLMLPKKDGPHLADVFLHGRTERPGSSASREGVCIAEIANIVVNAVANTVADACNDSFVLSAPMMTLGKKESLLKLAMDEFKASGETYAIMTYVSMSAESLSSDCTVLLLLSPTARGRILKALGL